MLEYEICTIGTSKYQIAEFQVILEGKIYFYFANGFSNNLGHFNSRTAFVSKFFCKNDPFERGNFCVENKIVFRIARAGIFPRSS